MKWVVVSFFEAKNCTSCMVGWFIAEYLTDPKKKLKWKEPTGQGPSSKALAKTPSGESHISPGILHLYVAEQT